MGDRPHSCIQTYLPVLAQSFRVDVPRRGVVWVGRSRLVRQSECYQNQGLEGTTYEGFRGLGASEERRTVHMADLGDETSLLGSDAFGKP